RPSEAPLPARPRSAPHRRWRRRTWPLTRRPCRSCARVPLRADTLPADPSAGPPRVAATGFLAHPEEAAGPGARELHDANLPGARRTALFPAGSCPLPSRLRLLLGYLVGGVPVGA